MNMVKFILAVLSALIDLLISRMKEIEVQGNNDSDGVPLDENYNTFGYLVASFRDIVRVLNENENEK